MTVLSLVPTPLRRTLALLPLYLCLHLRSLQSPMSYAVRTTVRLRHTVPRVFSAHFRLSTLQPASFLSMRQPDHAPVSDERPAKRRSHTAEYAFAGTACYSSEASASR